jgi:hypothetical protein
MARHSSIARRNDLRDGHQTIVAAKAILALDFLRLKLAAPGGVHDLENDCFVCSSGEREQFARPQGTEAGDEKDRSVAHIRNCCQQLPVHRYG